MLLSTNLCEDVLGYLAEIAIPHNGVSLPIEYPLSSMRHGSNECCSSLHSTNTVQTI